MTRPASRLDDPHYPRCPVARGADPDLCRCHVDEHSPGDRPASPAEMRRVQVLFRQAGITDRTERLARTGHLVGRRVTSCNQLTEAETRAVCAWLEQTITEARR